MRAMILKELRELRRDRRTVAMLVALPLLLLTIFGFAADFTVTTLSAVVVGPSATATGGTLVEHSDGTLQVDEVAPDEDRAWAVDQLAADRYDLAVVTTDGAAPEVLVDGSNVFAAQAAQLLVSQAGQQLAATGAPAPTTTVLFNPDLDTSWVMVPGLVGLILTFIGTIITSIGLVKERAAGTLEQLAVMPLRPVDVIVGKIAPYFLLASIDMVVVTLLGMLLFDVPFVGSVLLFTVGAAVFLLVVLGLGVLVSTISETTGQAIQVAMMMLLPQVLLSGIIFPLSTMPIGVRWIGYVLPLTWFNTISQGVMVRGAGWDSLAPSLGILVVMAVVVLGGAVLRFRASITPRRAHGHGRRSPAAAR